MLLFKVIADEKLYVLLQCTTFQDFIDTFIHINCILKFSLTAPLGFYKATRLTGSLPFTGQFTWWPHGTLCYQV